MDEENIKKDPFEKKDTNKEIDDILNESPIENLKSNNKLKTKIPGGKMKPSKKKVILTIGIIIILALIAILLIQNSCAECNCDTGTTEGMSNDDFVNLIKQQITSKGYAEISSGDFTMKVSPYTG